MISRQETFCNDWENVQDKLRQMIYDSKPITIEEKAELIHVLNDPKLRVAFTEVLNEVTGPRSIKDFDCLKLLSELYRFLLTLFVHE